MDDLTLASDFPAATREAWLQLVQGVLKGAAIDRLVSRTYDGLPIEPLYPKAEPSAQVTRGKQGSWRIAQQVDHPDPVAANALALADLQGGADSLTVVFPEAPAARGFGVAAHTVDDLDRALQGVMLDLIHVRVDAGGFGRQAAALLIALAERRGHRLADLDLDLGLDPVGPMAATGRLSAPWATAAGGTAETLAALREKGFSGRAVLADGRPYHEAGASEAQELAAVLSTAVAYLRALEDGGQGVETARDALAFLLVADADEFLTIAKFRALRRLWARVETACGLAPKPVALHAETSWRRTTRRDPWVNMLRATIAAFSAGVGGADGVTVLPFTAALGLPDAFARRIARNTQLVLLRESNLWRVSDPAAGAGGFEALTEALCEKAWALFQDIEREGGIVESLTAGALQDRIAAVRAERERSTARRGDPITGTSEFPDLREAAVNVLLPSPLWTGAGRREAKAEVGPTLSLATGPSGTTAQEGREQAASFASLVAEAGTDAAFPAAASPPAPNAVTPLPSIRSAERFERLRDGSDARLAETGSRPKLFLANLGPIAAFTARATFAKNLFEAGGLEAATNDGFGSLEALVAAFQASGARLACLCSSDEIYATQAVAAARALREAGAARVFLAGRPGESAEPLQAAGVSGYVFLGCDALAVLEDALASA